VCVADESVPLAQDPAYAAVIGLLLKAIAEGAAARGGVTVTTVMRPEQDLPPHVHTTASHTKTGETAQMPTDSGKDEPNDDNIEEGVRKKKGGLRKWFEERFLSETLDGDEDF
jgi:hypothetical protein